MEVTTSDLYFAAAIRTEGYSLRELRKVGHGPRMEFVFDLGEKEADRLRRAWLLGTLDGPLKEYAGHVKDLKSAVHNG